MADLKLALVVGVHPGQSAADLIMLDDGSRCPMVQVMSPSASSDSGFTYLPDPQKVPAAEWDLSAAVKRDIRAVVGSFRGAPIVLGFLFPQVSQMLFAQNRLLVRHDSGTYLTIAPSGDLEIYRPGGSFLRVGAPSHESLAGADADGRWVDKGGSAVNIHLEVGGGVASFDMAPSGDVTLSHTGALNVTTGAAATVNVTGAATLKSPAITLDGPVTVTKTLTVTQATTLNGGMTANGGGGGGGPSVVINGSAQINNGSVAVPNGDVVASGISQTGHHHTAQGANAPTSVAQA